MNANWQPILGSLLLVLLLVSCGEPSPNKGEAGSDNPDDNKQTATQGGDTEIEGSDEGEEDAADAGEEAADEEEMETDPAAADEKGESSDIEHADEDAFVDNTPDPDYNQLIAVDEEPVARNLIEVKESIVYPSAVRNDGISGTVYLKLLIDQRGRVKRYYVRKSPDRRLTRAVAAKLDKLRYKPASKGGQPVKVWVQFKHTF